MEGNETSLSTKFDKVWITIWLIPNPVCMFYSWNMSVFHNLWSAVKNSSNGMRYVDVDVLYDVLLNHTIALQDSSLVTPVTLRVDSYGYFLYWTDQNEVLSSFSPFVFSFTDSNCLCLSKGDTSAWHVHNSWHSQWALRQSTKRTENERPSYHGSFARFAGR